MGSWGRTEREREIKNVKGFLSFKDALIIMIVQPLMGKCLEGTYV